MAKGSTSKLKARAAPPPKHVEDDYLDSDSEVDEFAEDYDSQEDNQSEQLGSEEEEEEEEDGTGRWEADDWNENDDDNSDSEGGSQNDSDQEDDDEEDVQLKQLQNDLTSLPLSTLAKAQKSLSSYAKQRSSSSSSASSKEDKLLAIKAKLAQLQKGKGKAVAVDPYSGSSTRQVDDRGSDGDSASDSDSGPEQGSTKRGHKHAPTAMSTKKQVSRNRQVVDLHKPQRRDPRFSSVSAGNLDAHLHSASYSFLPSMLKEELSSLKIALAQAQKIERTCPWAEKAARTAEREKIELDLARVRTRLVKSQNEERERNVLARMKKEEREKREQGKGAWYMKKSEKRDLLLISKFESLEAQGGKSAVKKAMEKKRKKIASKEKKSRPFAKGSGGGGGVGEGGARKRQRV
ncbi:hypothetical protein V865_002633 [Kwoniella europaea PYCC6329]|uniref:rRNA biogenesis protein RRP36 n=1 Tax=Kwoniella europaea PYCC6329 TaxID=1423913 RepID=A0AAX4KFL0_9TREE